MLAKMEMIESLSPNSRNQFHQCKVQSLNVFSSIEFMSFSR